MSASQIQAENANFLAALNRGEITLEQYQAAMKFQNQRSQTQPVINEQADASENPYAQGSGSNFTYVNPKLIPRNEKIEQTQRVLEQKQTAQTFMEPSPTVNYDNPTPSAGPHPQRMYTTEEGTKIVTEGQENLKRTALITGSILAAPIIGPSGVLLGAGLGVGVSQGIKAVSGGGFLSGEELFESATTGIIFSGAGKLVTTGLQAIGAGAVVEGVGTGATKIVSGAAGRIGVNTALGAGGSYVLSGGNPEAAIEGAKYGLIFGVGGEVIGAVAARSPVPKYGEVKIPLKSGEEVTYKGLYLSRGSEVTRITGKTLDVPENALISEKYVPKSNIESNVALDVMKQGGYSRETVQNVMDVRTVMRTTQNTKPTTIDEALPTETGTLNAAGVKVVKDYVLSNKGDVKMLYGSYATKPQLAKTFEYSKAGKSALRTPGDIDIQLTTGEAGAIKFASELTTKLKATGADVRVSPEKPTLIEANVGGGKYAHAVDIHFRGEKPVDVLTPTRDVAWGFKFEKPTVQQEGIPTMALNEQGLRKGASILGFKEVPEGMVGPRLRRVKDIPDYFQVQKTLIEKMPARKTVVAREALARSEEYYGVDYTTDIPATPQRVAFNPRAETIAQNIVGVKIQKTAAFTSGSTEKASGTDASLIGKTVQSPSIATKTPIQQSNITYSPITKTQPTTSQPPKTAYPQTNMNNKNYITPYSPATNKSPSNNIVSIEQGYSPSGSTGANRGRTGLALPNQKPIDKKDFISMGKEPYKYNTVDTKDYPSIQFYPAKTKRPIDSTYKIDGAPIPEKYPMPSRSPSPYPSPYPGGYPDRYPTSPYTYSSGKSKKASSPFGSQMGMGTPDLIRSSGGLLKGKRRKEYPVLDAEAVLNKGN